MISNFFWAHSKKCNLKIKGFEILVKFWLCQSDVMLLIVLLLPAVAVKWCVPDLATETHFTREAHFASKGYITFRLRNISLKIDGYFRNRFFLVSSCWARFSAEKPRADEVYGVHFIGPPFRVLIYNQNKKQINIVTYFFLVFPNNYEPLD